MLDSIEMSDLYQFKDSLPENRVKELLSKLLFEYVQYSKCGTVEDCIGRKEWMSYSIDDIRNTFTGIVRGLRQEVQYVREDVAASHKKKRGRPRKNT